VWEFAQPYLETVQDNAHAEGMPKPSRDDVVSALAWLAAHWPPGVAKAAIEAYIKAEREWKLTR
jgi:hypothetical protein